MSFASRIESVTYSRLRAAAERRKEEEMELWLECTQDDETITLEEVKAFIAKMHSQDVSLPEKPRAISKYNVYCQQEKEKLADGQSVSTGLTPQILSEGYKNLSDAEHTELEVLVKSMEKRNQMEALIKVGLSKNEIWDTLMAFLKALYRFHGTEFIGIFGKKNTWNHVTYGENVSGLYLGRWKKEVRLHVNPKYCATPHTLETLHSQKVSGVKKSLRDLINRQCETSYEKIPWKQLVKFEDLEKTVLVSQNIVVENWPLPDFVHKNFMVRDNLKVVEDNLNNLKFKLSRHYNRADSIDTSND